MVLRTQEPSPHIEFNFSAGVPSKPLEGVQHGPKSLHSSAKLRKVPEVGGPMRSVPALGGKV